MHPSMELTLWCYSVILDKKLEILNIVTSSECNETLQLLWQSLCDCVSLLIRKSEMVVKKKSRVVHGQKWPPLENEWQIGKITKNFVCVQSKY